MIAWKHNAIEVGEKDVPELLGLDIVTFQFAEGGAMGYHGGVFFVTTKYHSTAIHEHAWPHTVASALPMTPMPICITNR